MSTDNSKVLKNQQNERSLFTLKSSNRTSRSMGQIGVTSCLFAMPKDTLKVNSGVAIEMKPTTQRIASQINYDRMSCAVPFRAIWHYWDEFIAKGGDILKNGAFSVPHIQKIEQESINSLPIMNSGNLLGYLLATLAQSNNRQLYQVSPDFVATNVNISANAGNVQDYEPDYIDFDGLVKLNTSLNSSNTSWILPKLIKSGFSESGINRQSTTVSSKTYIYYHFRNVDALQCFNILRDSPFTTVSVCVNTDTTAKKAYFLVGLGDSDEAMYSDMAKPTNTFYTFSVDLATSSSLKYGKVTISNNVQALTTDSANRFYMHASDNAGSKAENTLLYACALQCFFNSPDMLGYGSLCEQLGVHYFKQYSVSEYMYSYNNVYGVDFVNSGFFGDGSGSGYTRFIIDKVGRKRFNLTLPLDCFVSYANIGDDSICPYINLLPFYGYQKIVSDRFLLGHYILTNNLAQNSAVDTSMQYDSPYFRNNMIPTKCFYRPSSVALNVGYDQQCLYCDTVATGTATLKQLVNGVNASSLAPDQWHYTMHINQLCSIFFSRNVLRQMDVFTKIWQRQDMNVQNILNASSYQVVDVNQKLQAKSMILAKSLAKMIRFGGQDLTADKVIENHFGVNDVPCDKCEVIVLKSSQMTLKTEDVLNTGGAVAPDGSGDPLPLGDKTSIVANSIPVSYDFECFVPDFSLIYQLDWFSVPNYRNNVPNFVTNELGNRYNLIEDFKLAFFPEYQASGDESLLLSQIQFGADPSDFVGWTNKQNWLKDSSIEELNGEYQSKYLNQIVAVDPSWQDPMYTESLTYGYLQPNSSSYTLPIVDRFGQHFLVGYTKEVYKKSCMTKLNNVGL